MSEQKEQDKKAIEKKQKLAKALKQNLSRRKNNSTGKNKK